jgi:hypothetical protein
MIHSKKCVRRCVLAVFMSQGCKLVGEAAGGYLLNFRGLLGVQLTIQQAVAAEASGSGPQVSGRLVLLPAEAAAATAGAPAEGALKLQLLEDMGECDSRGAHEGTSTWG